MPRRSRGRLQIALTSKDAGGGRKIAMAGVPHHALDGYLAKLVLQQRVVALAEQLEAPIPNKLVRRDVVRVVTPGTLIEEQMLEPGAHNYLAAIAAVDDVVGLAHADVSTGHVMATAFSGESAFDDALGEIARLDPAEIVADVPADARAALERMLENARTRVVAPPLAAVPGAVAPIDGFSHDESLAMHRDARRARRVRAPRRRAAECGRGVPAAAVLLAERLPRARRQHAQAPRTAPRARQQRESDAAGDDRPHAHRDGLAAAGALAFAPLIASRRSRRAPTASRRS